MSVCVCLCLSVSVCVCRQYVCLTRALLHLSEQTHYSEVKTLMATPLKHCPEVLFLAVIECVVSHLVSFSPSSTKPPIENVNVSVHKD